MQCGKRRHDCHNATTPVLYGQSMKSGIPAATARQFPKLSSKTNINLENAALVPFGSGTHFSRSADSALHRRFAKGASNSLVAPSMIYKKHLKKTTRHFGGSLL